LSVVAESRRSGVRGRKNIWNVFPVCSYLPVGRLYLLYFLIYKELVKPYLLFSSLIVSLNISVYAVIPAVIFTSSVMSTPKVEILES
jgi:hypothetical protein